MVWRHYFGGKEILNFLKESKGVVTWMNIERSELCLRREFVIANYLEKLIFRKSAVMSSLLSLFRWLCALID